MPKKHRSTLCTKPPSTAPSSLSSTKNNGLMNKPDVAPSVNDLLSNLRKAGAGCSINDRKSMVMAVAQHPTIQLPPSVRSLLHVPDTPTPRPRGPRRVDANGRRFAGPAPPASWVTPSRASGSAKNRGELKYPDNILHLPGATMPSGLVHLCLQSMAKDWEFQSNYNTHYLATMPTRLRVLLLSYVAVYGPEEGIGSEALNLVIRPPADADIDSDFSGNDNFQRLDLSGSIGRSISFSQLTAIVVPSEEETDPEDWDADTSIYKNPTTFLPCLTHLSLSHPPPSISWPKFLAFAKNVPTITHLSLAHWPVPSVLAPNSKTTTVDPPHGLSLQYGGTNYYSHSLDGDWSEAAGILKRLSWALYKLEWLSLDGCTEWAPALRWKQSGINWNHHWRNIRIISLKSSYEERSQPFPNSVPMASSSDVEIVSYKEAIIKAVEVETHIRRQRGWIAVEHDEWKKYDDLLAEEDAKSWEEKLKVARFSRSDHGNHDDTDESYSWI